MKTSRKRSYLACLLAILMICGYIPDSSVGAEEAVKDPVVIEDFENGIDSWYVHGARYNSIDLSLATAPNDPVRLGNHAMRLDYDFIGLQGTSGVYASSTDLLEVEGYPEKIGMWVYGDGNNHWLRGQMRDGDGNWFPINFANNLTWEGWKYVEAAVPEGRPLPLRMDIPVRYMATSDDNKTAGTIYIDQIRAVYGDTGEDLVNPEITEVSPSDGAEVDSNTPVISAVVADDSSGVDAGAIQMEVNGIEVEHEYLPESGRVSYKPDSKFADGYHDVYLEVKDLAGNPKFKSWGFQIDSGGPEFSLAGPEEVYPGIDFAVELTLENMNALTNAEATISFDPEVLQLVDANPDEEGIQAGIDPVLTDDNVVINQVNNEEGSIQLAFANLDEVEIDSRALHTIAELTFTPGVASKGAARVELGQSKYTYLNGSERTARLLPYEAEITQPLLLEAKGISVGSETTFTVTSRESDEPVEGAIIRIDEPQANLLTVKEQADIFSTPEGESVVKKAKAGDRFISMKEEGEFAQIILEDGEAGWLHRESGIIESWGNPLGSTNENGELTTDIVALSLLTIRLQAQKDAYVSQLMELEILPQLGSQKPENLVLSWQDSPKTTQSITWRTKPSINNTVVQLVKKEDQDGFNSSNLITVQGDSSLFADPIGEMRVHEAEAVDLEPGTVYRYRAGSGIEGQWSEEETFRTEAENEPFTFLFTADSQAGNPEGFNLWRQLFIKGLEKHPDARFMLHGGDVVENGNLLKEWDHFFDASKGLISKIPFMATLGNHDVYGEGEETFRSNFQYPKNGPEGEEEFVYAYDYGDAQFLVLNSEASNESVERQSKWLKEMVEASDQQWQIVMFHRPPYLSNPLRGSDRTLEIFAPVIEEAKVDFVLSGHDHNYMRTFPMQNGEPAEEGTVYITGGSAGPKFYPGEKYEYADKLFSEDVQLFSAFTVSEDKVTLEVTTVDGRTVDSGTWTKNAKPAPDEQKIINLSDYDDKRVTVFEDNVEIVADKKSKVKHLIIRGTNVTFSGKGFKDIHVTLHPRLPGSEYDFSGDKIKKVEIRHKNASVVKGAENIQKLEVKGGAKKADVQYFDSEGNEINPFIKKPGKHKRPKAS
ncbi:metallophosphoesterase [Jeotgalibacillus sp. ET6]|uniref:metallophosphoesterase n=1 Tax=Jeotgalibacillus sp. ET6 TaxID=3037260 RepID=UPI0024189CAE|nr:metallophosphoesterase [Jeotgalibacillus sp. ET6]MDG5472542.1 metallophosphoesterase [Jeotgalibacillus sp. ET6]